MKVVSLFIILMIFSGSIFSQRKIMYDLPGADVSSDVICGQPKICECITGDNPTDKMPYRFARKPYQPSVKRKDSAKTVAASIIGKSVPWARQGGESLMSCGTGTSRLVVTENDVDITGSETGYNFTYTTKKKVKIDVGATVEADVKKIIAGKNPSSLLVDSLKATLVAAYQRIKDRSLTITGTYYEMRLGQNLYEKLVQDSEFQECRNYLKTNDRAIISDISLLTFDLERSFEIDRTAIAGLQGKLLREGIDADLSALIESNVLKGLQSSVNNGYAVISWVKQRIQ